MAAAAPDSDTISMAESSGGTTPSLQKSSPARQIRREKRAAERAAKDKAAGKAPTSRRIPGCVIVMSHHEGIGPHVGAIMQEKEKCIQLEDTDAPLPAGISSQEVTAIIYEANLGNSGGEATITPKITQDLLEQYPQAIIYLFSRGTSEGALWPKGEFSTFLETLGTNKDRVILDKMCGSGLGFVALFDAIKLLASSSEPISRTTTTTGDALPVTRNPGTIIAERGAPPAGGCFPFFCCCWGWGNRQSVTPAPEPPVI